MWHGLIGMHIAFGFVQFACYLYIATIHYQLLRLYSRPVQTPIPIDKSNIWMSLFDRQRADEQRPLT